MSKKEENLEKSGIFKSHSERLSQSRKVYPKSLCQDYEVRDIQTVVENDKYVRKALSKVVHPQDKFKGFSASDFDLEAIIAVGALDSLKECMLSGDTLNVADCVEGSVDNIISAVESEVNSKGEGE